MWAVASRRLDPAEAQAWARVMASVRPLKPKPTTGSALGATPDPVSLANPLFGAAAKPAIGKPPAQPQRRPPAPRERANTLDGSWDRSLARGVAQPDSSLDLHGHTLGSAHALLDQGLATALARGERLLLLVTGKPPRPDSERPHARGAIRAAVADWLAASRHADRIAAVRNAHPRHGGAGALYIVLRRQGRVDG